MHTAAAGELFDEDLFNLADLDIQDAHGHDDTDYGSPQPVARREKLRAMKRTLEKHLREAEDYLRAAPHERQTVNLARHTTILNDILTNLRASELAIPPVMHQQYCVRIANIMEELEAFQANTAELVSGAPDIPEQHYVILLGGGYKLILDRAVMEELCPVNMSDIKIGELMRCSAKTVKRRREEWGITKREWDDITPTDLALNLEQLIRHGGKHEGEKGLAAGLLTLGIEVPRSQLRSAMDLLGRDPRNAPQPVVCHIYCVPWINSLWHMDGHHKLIHWKTVIRGCIDGFLRMVTFMKAVNNNRADTVLKAFEGAVDEFGWPSRVRSDQGKENWEVKKLMESVQGESYINSLIHDDPV